MQGNRLDAAAQMQPLCLGEGVGFGVRRDPRQPQHRQDQLCRQQGVENVAEVAVGTVGKIPLDPFVQLFRSQTGFQVDLQPVVLWAALSHQGTGTEYQRTGHAEVGEQHFAQFLKDALVSPIQPQDHVPQGKPHGFLTPCFLCDQRDQGGHWRHNGVTGCFCQTIA